MTDIASSDDDTRVLVPTDAPSPTPPPSEVTWSLDGRVMDTAWSARVIAPPGAEREAFQRAIQSELDAVAALIDISAPDSEIARFNAAPSGTWQLSANLMSLLDDALSIGDETDGSFDPTLGALSELWGLGLSGPRPTNLLLSQAVLPTDDEIASALALSGWQKLRLHRPASAAVQPGGLMLDLSALACGLMLDRVSEKLVRLGATSHLLELGGRMKGLGVRPDGHPWWIEIAQPPHSPAPRTVAALLDLAMATASVAHRAYRADDQTISPILNGRTGRPIDNGLVAVTVLHTSALTADALSTALCVMGPASGLAFAADVELAAHFIEQTHGGLVEHVTPAFVAMMDQAKDA